MAASRDVPIGTTFGRWTTVSRPTTRYSRTGRPNRVVACQCICGTRREVLLDNLVRRGGSCGCLESEITSNRNRTHGASGSSLYRVWQAMRNRCYRQSGQDYPLYGGRGIVVCEEWRTDFAAFQAWALENGYRPGLSIDRVDNDGPYSPANCRWASSFAQAHNKRNNLIVTAFGEEKCLAEWADDPRCTVSYGTLQARLNRGWDAERAISAPKDLTRFPKPTPEEPEP